MTNISDSGRANRQWSRVNRAEIVPIWKAAELLLKPEEETQRKVFESLMPYIYSLRDKGCSWNQITDLVIKSGLNLQPSTVRTYYSEMLATRQDVCQARMTDQILLMTEVKKSQESGEESALKKKLDEILKKTAVISPRISSKIDSIFGKGDAQDEPADEVAGSGPQGAKAEKIFAGLRPSPKTTPKKTTQTISLPTELLEEPAAQSEFGLLNTGTSGKKVRKAGFFADMDAPGIPSLTPDPGPVASPSPAAVSLPVTKKEAVQTTVAVPVAAAAPESRVLRCMPLASGVPTLAARAGVDPACYLPGQLEHPVVAGLMLSLDERVYSAALEFACSDGTIRLESLEEKRFRIKWKAPISMTKSSTDGDFTTMDHSIFKQV